MIIEVNLLRNDGTKIHHSIFPIHMEGEVSGLDIIDENYGIIFYGYKITPYFDFIMRNKNDSQRTSKQDE